MSFLLRKTADGPQGAKTDLVALISDHVLAIGLAKEWVGELQEGENISRVRREQNTGFGNEYTGAPGTYWIYRTVRGTEQGQRRATVQPLNLDDEDKGLA